MTNQPHQGQPIRTAGAPLEHARAAMILAHGRGATAEDILSVAQELHSPDCAYLAPQAANNSWWPQRFMEPIARNEPWLSSALACIGEVLARVSAAGIPPERTLLLGFSQGACLVAEYAARHAQRYGGVAVLSGGLVGPDGTARDYTGTLNSTPIFLGCSDVDSHIPKARVKHSAAVLRGLGAQVTMRLYPNMEHTIHMDELEFVRGMVTALTV